MLTAGTRVGGYEIVGSLGAGGMGEVYRARDPKLGREVALKVLPEAFAADPERVARFDREARTLAALNHPHIAHVYGFEQSGAASALVMELVEGEDLGQRLERGPLPLDETIAIATQLTDALDAAHAQGIIHRDLKPANIKVRADGTVKVLDFGLAKALEPATASSTAGHDVLNSPTITSPAMTRHGMILGTAAYMAPEQAKGRPLDKRADIWAFGCVLFEMMSGVRAFGGEDVTDTLAFVITREPEWNALPASTPPVLRTLLRRCLEKDRRRRLADIADARLDLDDALRTPELVTSPAPAIARGGVSRLAAAAIGLAAAAVAAALVWGLTRPAARPAVTPTRFTIVAPSESPLSLIRNASGDRSIAISPDGRRVVYRASVDSVARLMLRDLSSLDVQVVPNVGGVRGPFFSPDGQSVGFFVGGELRRRTLNGGTVSTVCASGNVSRGGSWGADNRIVFATTDPNTGLLSVPAAGGTPEALTAVNQSAGELDHLFPVVLPGARAVVFTLALSGDGRTQIAVLDLRTKQYRVVIDNGARATYSTSGHLVYQVDQALWAVRFDANALQVTGEPVAVLDEPTAEFAIADNGTLVAVPAGSLTEAPQRLRSLVWVDRKGNEQPLDLPEKAYSALRISPDGTRLASTTVEGAAEIWIADLVRGGMRRLTNDPADEQGPVWTPDSRRLIFSSNRNNNPNLYWQAADGTGAAVRITSSNLAQFATSITPDGARVIFFEFDGRTFTIQTATVPGPSPPATSAPSAGQLAPPQRLLETAGRLAGAEISPDGRWIAYQENEGDGHEVVVRPFPDAERARWQASTQGGSRPAWSRTGRELYYQDADGMLTSVSVSVAEGTAAPAFGKPVRILDKAYVSGGTVLGIPLRGFDVSPDGQRFLVIKEQSQQAERPASLSTMTVVLDWFEELRARISR